MPPLPHTPSHSTKHSSLSTFSRLLPLHTLEHLFENSRSRFPTRASLLFPDELEECSVCSDNDHTAESSQAPCDKWFANLQTDISRENGSTIRYVGSSKPPIQYPSVAFPAAYERGPLLVPILASTRTTEFFELSPPR